RSVGRNRPERPRDAGGGLPDGGSTPSADAPSGYFPCAGGSAIQGSAALERVLEVAGSAARDDPGAADGADSRTGVFDPAIRSPMPIDAAKALAAQPRKTGRASGRERVEIWAGAGSSAEAWRMTDEKT